MAKDFDNKILTCTPAPAGARSIPAGLESNTAFRLHYDKLVIAVGAYSQSEYCPKSRTRRTVFTSDQRLGYLVSRNTRCFSRT